MQGDSGHPRAGRVPRADARSRGGGEERVKGGFHGDGLPTLIPGLVCASVHYRIFSLGHMML